MQATLGVRIPMPGPNWLFSDRMRGVKTLEFLQDLFKDVEFIISEKSKDPYDFV